MQAGSLEQIMNVFLELFTSLPKLTKERISSSLVDVADILIGSGALTRAIENGWADYGMTLFNVVKAEVFKSKDVKKLLSAIKL